MIWGGGLLGTYILSDLLSWYNIVLKKLESFPGISLVSRFTFLGLQVIKILVILSAKPLNKSKEDPSYRRISSHYNDIVIYAYKKVLVRLMFYQASDESYGYIDIKNPHVYWWPSTLNKIGFKKRKKIAK